LLRRLAVISFGLAFLLAAARVETARRPRRGGTLRMEVGAIPNPETRDAKGASPEDDDASDQIYALTYDERNPGRTFIGAPETSPFLLEKWEPGKYTKLVLNWDSREGPPYLDAIEIQIGRTARDRLVSLELGKADFTQLPPQMARQAADRGVRLSISQPDELLALVFPVGRAATDDARVREALARAIDRDSIVNFILQKTGEPAGGLLPQWSSGTAFLFPTTADPARAKELWAQIAGTPKLVLGYDSADPLGQSVTERIVVNAREAKISMVAQAVASAASVASLAAPGPDARLIRLRISSSLPRAALSTFLATLGPVTNIDASALPDPASPQDIYDRERAVVSTFRVIPLVWLPRVYGLSARVRNWKAPGPGETWPLADVWLDGPPDAAADKANP
jgi:peptide/nickel transport system substrate-binding protein